MAVSATTLSRFAGVAAAAAGLIFIGVQFNHPPLDVTSVTTTEWAVRNSLKVVMAALALAGITGMYLRQVTRTKIVAARLESAFNQCGRNIRQVQCRRLTDRVLPVVSRHH
jgi:hypothetical protein